jgi:hypothetical protein
MVDAARMLPRLLRWSARALIATCWLSAVLFAAYILRFYVGAPDRERWNTMLPELFTPGSPAATGSIGAHFVMGALLLFAGPLQLLPGLRARAPTLHRWLGRAYVLASLGAGLGGMGFIALRGTVGGPPMSLGFGLYGAAMVVSALQTFWWARHHQPEAHARAAWRLFSLAIGSWEYRMLYGFWFGLTGAIGHTRTFTGPFDVFMAFAFWVPNLALVEAFRGWAPSQWGLPGQLAALAGLWALTLVLAVGTSFIVVYSWGPGLTG